MKQIREMLKIAEPNTNIIFIDKEKLEFDDLKDYKDLYHHIIQKTDKTCKNVVMIDEVQEIESFEKTLRDLNENPRYDIFCTGSNATLLSGELSTFLAGRYVEIMVSSLSYKEFLFFHKLDHSMDAVGKYVKFGGMPYL
ncbi:MAG: AAA family ATPase, partial [Desulfobacula sp.]|nr:AAA family ATPase [Desulfobacula sp.]